MTMATNDTSGQLYRMVGMMAMVAIGVAVIAPTASETLVGSAEVSEAQGQTATTPPPEPAPNSQPVVRAAPSAPVEFGVPTMSTEPIDVANYRPQNDAAPAMPDTDTAPANPYRETDNANSVNPPSAPARANDSADIPPELARLPRPGPKVGTIIGKRPIQTPPPAPGGIARFE